MACGDSFGVAVIMFVRTVDVRRGIGASGSFVCKSRGRKALNGSGCSDRAVARAGIPRARD